MLTGVNPFARFTPSNNVLSHLLLHLIMDHELFCYLRMIVFPVGGGINLSATLFGLFRRELREL